MNSLKKAEELAAGTGLSSKLAALSILRDHNSSEQGISLLRRLADDPDQTVAEAAQRILGTESLALKTDETSLLTELSLDLAETSKAHRSEANLELLTTDAGNPDIEFPVPQANSLDVICNLLARSQTLNTPIRELLAMSGLSPRQWDYYENTVGFLRLSGFNFGSPETIVESGKISLSDFVSFTKVLLGNHEVLRRLIQAKILAAEAIFDASTKDLLRVWVSELGLPAFSEDTLTRRSQSIDAWAKWISWRLEQLESFNDGTKTTFPEPINVAPMIVAFLGALKGGAPTSLKPGRRKKLLGGGAQTVYSEGDFVRIRRRLTRFHQAGGITLEEEGAVSGITRERVRQLENKFERLLEIVVESDGMDAIYAVQKCLEDRVPLNLADWALNSLRSTIREELVHLSRYPDTSPLHNDLDWVDFDDWEIQETLTEKYGPEPVSLLPGGDWGAVGLALMVLRNTLLHEGMDSSRSTNDLWLEDGRMDNPELQSLVWPESAQVRNRSHRLARIQEALADGPLSAPEIANKVGEASSHALAEFMRRQPHLAVRRGLWSIKDEDHVEAKFSSAYDALIHVLTTYGPASTTELSERLEEVHPMTISRLQQAMDDGRVGRMDDGRVGLISQGASRKEEIEPKIPTRLILKDDQAWVILTASKDHLRGSGFQVPAWLGWKFGLKATPDSVKLTSSRGDTLSLTRRGGQIYASSIRTFLEKKNIEVGCSFELKMELAARKFEITHLCQSH